MPATADIGLIGLAVMGQNLALNIADHGFNIAVFNRTTSTMKDWVAKVKKEEPSGNRVSGHETLKDFVAAVKSPRKFIILVKAGPAIDAVTKELIDAGVEPEDIIVDAGNSFWTDTIRREKDYASQVQIFRLRRLRRRSRRAASAHPSCPAATPIPGSISSRSGKRSPPRSMQRPASRSKTMPGKPVTGGVPCTAYIGPNGAGHYVKMVHNGIEYIDMQLICEAYTLMQNLLGIKPDELSKIFAKWNEGDLDSYLIQITADILQQHDPVHKEAISSITCSTPPARKARANGPSVNALDMGIPANAIAEAVFARCLSALKDERVAASKVARPVPTINNQRSTVRRSSPRFAMRFIARKSARTRRAFS